MQRQTASAFLYAQNLVQKITMVLMLTIAVGLIFASILAAIGQWHWIEMGLSFGGEPIQNAGMYVQLGLTLLAVSLCFYLPSNNRLQQLELSHRNFTLSSEDVAHAYAICHSADRSGTFKMGGDFDAVRERMEFMASHPDLELMETDVLQLAAQMSTQSSELANLYSDEKVQRAKTFLDQRQQELTRVKARIEDAKTKAYEITRWAKEIDLEESVAKSQLQMLEDELSDVLTPLGFHLDRQGNVVSMPRIAGE